MATKHRANHIRLFTFYIFLVFANLTFLIVGGAFAEDQDKRSSKVMLVSGLNYCLDVNGANSSSEGEWVGIYNCNEVTEKWFFSPASDKIKVGYDTTICLDVEGDVSLSSTLRISNCGDAIAWIHGDDGKICAYDNTNLCLGFSWRRSIYETQYSKLQLRYRDETDAIWSFRSYEPRSDVSQKTKWILDLYGHDNYPNKTNKLDYPLSRLRTFFYYHWRYMPTYLKKHALNSPPTVVVNRNNWNDERAQGAPWVSYTNSMKALESFFKWIKEKHSSINERRMNIFIKWNEFNSDDAGEAYIASSNPQNDRHKVGVVALKPRKKTLTHEIGHTFNYHHYSHRCYLPGTGRRYSFMHYKDPQKNDSLWYGPLPCQSQEEVSVIFYQLAFGGHLKEWERTSFKSLISYDEESDSLILTSDDSKYDDFISDGGELHLMLGQGANYAKSLSSLLEANRPSALALFTVVIEDEVHYLVPDDPLAYKFFSYHKSAGSQNRQQQFSYYRRR